MFSRVQIFVKTRHSSLIFHVFYFHAKLRSETTPMKIPDIIISPILVFFTAVLTIFNPAPATALTDSYLQFCDIIVLNETEVCFSPLTPSHLSPLTLLNSYSFLSPSPSPSPPLSLSLSLSLSRLSCYLVTQWWM